MTSRRIRSLVIVAAVVLVAGGCTRDDGTPMAADVGRLAASGPQEARFVAIDYSYPEAPAQLEAGLVHVTFENRGTVGHELTFTGIGDATATDLVEDLKGTGLSGEPFPPFVDQVAVPPFVSVEPGEAGEATFTLSEGRYSLLCTITDVAVGDRKLPHYKLGMARELTVVAGDPYPELPQADGTITATDYAFDVDLEAGDRTVNFVNEGPDQVHLTTIEAFPEGVDEAEARAAFEATLKDGPAPAGNPSPSGVGFGGIFSDGLGAQIELDEDAFQSGRTYLFACWAPDREGGEPHAVTYRMYEVITIE